MRSRSSMASQRGVGHLRSMSEHHAKSGERSMPVDYSSELRESVPLPVFLRHGPEYASLIL